MAVEILSKPGSEKAGGLAPGRRIAAGAGDVVDMATAGLAWLANRVPDHRAGRAAPNPQTAAGTQLGARARAGITPKEDLPTGQRVAASALEGLGGAAATLPFGMLGAASKFGAAGRAGIELLSGATASTASDVVGQMTDSEAAQFAASMLAGMAPGAAASAIRGAGRVGGAAIPGVRNRLARKLAAEQLGDRIANRAQAIEILRREVDAPLFGRASTAQALDDLAPAVGGLEKQLAFNPRVGGTLQREMSELHLSNARAARDLGESLFGVGSPEDAIADFAAKLARVRAKVATAYARAGDLGGIPTRKVKAAAALVAQEAGDELASALPHRELRIIAGYGDEINLRRLDNLRKNLVEQATRAAREGKANRARVIGKVVDAIEETFDEVAEAGGGEKVRALRVAQQTRRLQAERFDPKSRRAGRNLLHEILGGEYENLPERFGKYLRGAKRPAEGLSRLRLTLGDNPEAWGGIKKLMRDEVFGEDFSRLFTESGEKLGKSGSALASLKRHRASFEAVFGEGSARQAEELIRRAKRLGTGVVGRKAFDATTASGKDVAETLRIHQGIVADLSGNRYGSAAIRLYRMLKGHMPNTMEEADEVMAEALLNPGVAEGLLSELPPAAVAPWLQRAQRTTGRGIRAGSFVNREE